MEKIINKKIFSIRYNGKIPELKLQLEYLALQWGKQWISQLEKIEGIDKALSSYDQRIYYNTERLIYLPNYHSKFIIFPTMLIHSQNADKLFLKNHPEYKIKVE